MSSRAHNLARLAASLNVEDQAAHAFADLHDFLAKLSADEFLIECAASPFKTTSGDFVQNDVAAMVDHTAARLGVDPPSWTRAIPALKEPFFATDLASLRLYLLTSSPAAFRRRNLFVDAADGDRV